MLEWKDATGNVIYGVTDQGRVTALGVDVQASGIVTTGKVASKQDVDVQEIGKGIVVKSPNGHRWRMGVTDAGITSWTDLDA